MRKTKVTKCENTDMQENTSLFNRGTRLLAIVAMTCEAVIGVYMHTVLRMLQYAKIVQIKLIVISSICCGAKLCMRTSLL